MGDQSGGDRATWPEAIPIRAPRFIRAATTVPATPILPTPIQASWDFMTAGAGAAAQVSTAGAVSIAESPEIA